LCCGRGMTWDECAAELDALLVWWMVERRLIAGAPGFRVTGRSRADGRVVQAQSVAGESLDQLATRFIERLQSRGPGQKRDDRAS
jgi:hypothetical protein